MAETLFNFFSVLGDEFALFMISLIPLVEERGAIIYAAAINFPWAKALPICIIANMIPVPFILIFGTKLLNYLKTTKLLGNFFTKYEKKLHTKADSVRKYGSFALTAFTGIPVPGTGAWSGSLIATILGIDFKHAFFSILLGVSIAGVIMTIISYGAASIFTMF